MRQSAGTLVIMPGPERRIVDLETHRAAQASARHGRGVGKNPSFHRSSPASDTVTLLAHDLVRKPLHTFRDHAPANDQAYRPATIGMRAARMAGNSPPIRPTASASSTPCQISAGLSLKANTTCVKLPPSVEAVRPSKIRSGGGRADQRRRSRRAPATRPGPDEGRKAAEADRAQGRDLDRARRDRGIHRVERAGERAERHRDRERPAELLDQVGGLRGLVGEIGGFRSSRRASGAGRCRCSS